MGNFGSAAERLRPLSQRPDENFVLNNLRLGSTAMIRYDFREAENAFLRAYEVINSTGVQGGGRSLGAILVDEKIKIWKGEPFERAMANFYLGLLYYIQHDYGNARGAFENALFKLRDYADEQAVKANRYDQVESSFTIAYLMLGRCWQKLGRDDLADANFRRVAELRPRLRELADPQRNARANLLLVVEFGHGPRKVTDFDGAIVGFAPLPYQVGEIPPPYVTLSGQPIEVSAMTEAPIDLLVMAQDRRWQSIDTIRTIKSMLGTGLIAGGAGYGIYQSGRPGGMSGSDAAIAAGLVGAGLLLKAGSQADVRQWEMLPRTVFVLPLQVPPGTHDLTVEFPDAQGLRQTWRDITVPSQGEATYYIRMQRWNPGPFQWPPPPLRDTPPWDDRP